MNKTLSMRSTSEAHSGSTRARTLPLPPAITKAEESTQFSSPQPKRAAKDAPQAGRAGASGRKVHAGAASRLSTTTRKAARPGRDRVSTARNLALRRDGETACSVDRTGFANTNPGPRAVAASDDAKHSSAAGIEPMGTSRAGRSSRDRQKQNVAACAAAAQSRIEIDETMPKRESAESARQAQAETEALKVPTNPAALTDGPAYVRAVASKVDLVGASARLVVSTDEKVAKAELDRLRELIFGKGGPPAADETVRMDFTSMYTVNSDAATIDDATRGEQT